MTLPFLGNLTHSTFKVDNPIREYKVIFSKFIATIQITVELDLKGKKNN